jgi:hypothetical protein
MVCQWFVLKTTSTVFSSLASKSVVTVFSSLASKPVVRFLPIWPQNRWWVSWFSLETKAVEGFPVWPQNQQLWFGDLGIKITATVSWFRHQNQAGYGLSVAPQNR